MQLTNQTILITGGTSGIGRALVDQLVHENNLIVVSRDQQKLDQLQLAYPNIKTYACSLEQTDNLLQHLEIISNDCREISVIINNAATQYNKKLTDADFDLASIQHEINLNLVTPVTICAFFVPLFLQRKQPSAIINLSSGLAFFPKVSSAVYSATKAGLHNFSQSLGYQVEKTPIKAVDVILPPVDTYDAWPGT
jgi:uncharacterized oxidoreductase